MTDIVIFRRWKAEPKSVIALFPRIDAGRGFCSSYEHIGQHGGADYNHVIASTRPTYTNDDDVQELFMELTLQIGYTLRIQQRRS